MSDPELPLDSVLRTRLLALADEAERHESGLVDAAARERAIQRTLAKARSPRRVHAVPVSPRTAALLAVAAALLLVVWQPWARSPAAPRGAKGAGEQPHAAVSAKAAVPGPPCALAAPLQQAHFVADDAGARTFRIGAHATALASADAVVQADLRAPCTANLTVGAGRVSVHARDLAGGQLEVSAGEVRVLVTGTVFAVEREGQVVRVSLAEGHVSIHVGDGPAEALDAGMRAVVDGGPLRREPLAADARIALLTEHGLQVPAALLAQAMPASETDSPAPSIGAARAMVDADSLLSQADAERRAGRVAQARELYRRASTGSGMAAEAAWMRLCQLELDAGRLDAATQALASYERRFPRGTLGAEAAWTAVRVAQRRGDSAAARRAAERLVASHPRSPQAEAARRLLGASGR